ncbi:MAG: hypothetical protein ABR574_03890 [Cryomorphaceae bacterium]
MRGCIFLFTLIFILGSACQPSSNGNNVDLFNGISIALNSSEEVVEFTEADTDAYFEILGDRPYQAPLYRKVESGEASLYIGIPVGTGAEEILGFREDASIKSFDKWKYSYSQYEKGGVKLPNAP